MADFFALRKRRAEIEEEYFRTLQTANDHYDRETEAAIVIQSAYRSCRVRHRWHKVQKACQLVQRCARGMLGRARYDAFLLRRANMCNLAYFNHCSTTIQKALFLEAREGDVFLDPFCLKFEHACRPVLLFSGNAGRVQ